MHAPHVSGVADDVGASPARRIFQVRFMLMRVAVSLPVDVPHAAGRAEVVVVGERNRSAVFALPGGGVAVQLRDVDIFPPLQPLSSTARIPGGFSR